MFVEQRVWNYLKTNILDLEIPFWLDIKYITCMAPAFYRVQAEHWFVKLWHVHPLVSCIIPGTLGADIYYVFRIGGPLHLRLVNECQSIFIKIGYPLQLSLSVYFYVCENVCRCLYVCHKVRAFYENRKFSTTHFVHMPVCLSLESETLYNPVCLYVK